MNNRTVTNTGNSGGTLKAERYEEWIPAADIAHSLRFQELCRPCPHYGKNLACPPQSPDFASYVGSARFARVICMRIPLKGPEKTVDELKAIARDAGTLLAKELSASLKLGHKVAGSGFCRSCAICAAESGPSDTGSTICRKPDERIFSLESMGVDVDALMKRCFGFGLEWTKGDQHANYLCIPGAVFYDERPSDNDSSFSLKERGSRYH